MDKNTLKSALLYLHLLKIVIEYYFSLNFLDTWIFEYLRFEWTRLLKF